MATLAVFMVPVKNLELEIDSVRQCTIFDANSFKHRTYASLIVCSLFIPAYKQCFALVAGFNCCLSQYNKKRYVLRYFLSIR